MTHWIPAPQQTDCQNASGAVLGVTVGEDEYVRWAWTILPDGRRVVTGYDIIPIPLPEILGPPKEY